MICYRDMTFCPFYSDCAKAKDCHRPLTPEVKAAADKWWGKEGAPIARWAAKPECHETNIRSGSEQSERNGNCAAIRKARRGPSSD